MPLAHWSTNRFASNIELQCMAILIDQQAQTGNDRHEIGVNYQVPGSHLMCDAEAVKKCNPLGGAHSRGNGNVH